MLQIKLVLKHTHGSFHHVVMQGSVKRHFYVDFDHLVIRRPCRRSETRALLPSSWLDYSKLQPNMTAHARNSHLQRTSPQSCQDRSELACDGYHHRPSNGDPVIDALIVFRIIVPADSADVFGEASGGPHTSTAVVCKCCDEIIANRVCVCVLVRFFRAA